MSVRRLCFAVVDNNDIVNMSEISAYGFENIHVIYQFHFEKYYTLKLKDLFIFSVVKKQQFGN